jgi:hypothetical protein
VDGPTGIYLISLQLRSAGLTTSEPFYLLIGKGVAETDPLFEHAVDVAHDMFLSLPCPADLDRDGDVDLADLGGLLASFGIDAAGDTDGDGDTDLADLGAVLSAFGEQCA